MQTASTEASSGWNPDLVRTYATRLDQVQRFRKSPAHLAGALAYYSTRPAEFIDHWCDTYDPRVAGGDKPTHMPFRLFKRQFELVEFLEDVRKASASGLVEKCRDMGATFVCCGYSIWLWRFVPGSAIGWGSRKAELVDNIGDPKSVFEKLRVMMRRLPREFMPPGYKEELHSHQMRIVNPDNGSSIVGEVGDNIGRGGRTTIYFKDESAHYEHPEMIEAALSDNTNVQIDISSVNGPGNPFHNRREAGKDWEPGVEVDKVFANVFVMDWRDHPAKTIEWYRARETKWRAEGLYHIHAQEVDRNYYAAVSGTIIDITHLEACIDAHKTLGFPEDGPWGAALDVADNDGTGDRNAFAARRGPILRLCDDWTERDTGTTTRRALGLVEGLGNLDLQYDCIGLGSGVKAEWNRLADDNLTPRGVQLVAWNGGDAPQNADERMLKKENGEPDEESPLIGDFFVSLKAQGWWELARRIERTYRAVVEDIPYPFEDLISIPSTLPKLRQIKKELCQPTGGKSTRMKFQVNKTPEGTRSPNLGDAIMMAFWPILVWQPPAAVFGAQSRHAR